MMFRALISLACLLFMQTSFALDARTPEEDMAITLNIATQAAMRNIKEETDGYLTNIGGDGHLIFDALSFNRDQLCGVKFDIEFKQPLLRPGLFELFWRGSNSSFSEKRKVFFIINQADTLERKKYLIPLCKSFNYSGNIDNPAEQSKIVGLRFDYPNNKDVSIKFHGFELLDSVNRERVQLIEHDLIILEPYERLKGSSFTSLDVVLPKLFFSFEEGLHRFYNDKPFLIFWLFVIVVLIFLFFRSWFRSTKD